MSRTFRLAGIATLMTAFLAFMLVTHLDRRANSPEILVDVQGYDPRDIFLGHFAAIRTPLGRLDAASLDGDDDFARGDPVFVALSVGEDGLARPVALYREHPGAPLVARGYVTAQNRQTREWVVTTDPDTGEVTRESVEVDYNWVYARFNIERYFASEAIALALQDRLRETDEDGDNGVRLILAVPEDGALLIKGLEVDGERRVDSVW